MAGGAARVAVVLVRAVPVVAQGFNKTGIINKPRIKVFDAGLIIYFAVLYLSTLFITLSSSARSKGLARYPSAPAWSASNCISLLAEK